MQEASKNERIENQSVESKRWFSAKANHHYFLRAPESVHAIKRDNILTRVKARESDSRVKIYFIIIILITS